MTEIKQCFKNYIGELHEHLFKNTTVDSIIQDMGNSHRKQRFISMYLIQDRDLFYRYYNKRIELGLSDLFNQVISGLLHNVEKERLKQIFVNELGLHRDLITEEVSSFKVKEVEKDLRAFSFYQTKIELQNDLD